MRDYGLHIVLLEVGSAKKNIQSTLHEKDVTVVPRRQVESCGKQNIIFPLEQRKTLSRVISPITTTDYDQTCYKEEKKQLMGFSGQQK